MLRIDWDKKSEKQFNSLPQEVRDDWAELRAITLKHN